MFNFFKITEEDWREEETKKRFYLERIANELIQLNNYLVKYLPQDRNEVFKNDLLELVEQFVRKNKQ